MNRIPICRIQLVREATLPAPTCQIQSPGDAAGIVRAYLGHPDREHFVVLCLDQKHHVVAIHTASVGSLTATLVHPREVFKPAILANSAAVIVAHNHPTGDPEPSRDDQDMTVRLAQAGRILGIDVVDHVIVGGERFCSLRERGWVGA